MASFKTAFAATEVEIPTTELYVQRVLQRVPFCPVVHGDEQEGEPCFTFQSLISDAWISGICNARARKAGMTAPIRPQSLDRSISNAPYRGHR